MDRYVIYATLLNYIEFIMRYLLLTCMIFLADLSFGQFQKLINQSIEVKEATKVEVNLNGTVTYQEWEGTFLLIETKVVIENCNENIFRAFVADGRYKVASQTEDDIIKLTSHKSLGQKVRSKLGETKEKVHFKIYYPKGFKDSKGDLLISTIQHETISGGE